MRKILLLFMTIAISITGFVLVSSAKESLSLERLPINIQMQANISVCPNTVASGDSSRVIVNIIGVDHFIILGIPVLITSPVSGANINISVMNGILENETGLTDMYGEFETSYISQPYLRKSRTFNITVNASRFGLENSSSTQITVNPKLYVNVSKIPDTVPSKGKLKIRIHTNRDCGTEPNEFCSAIYPPLPIHADNVSINLTTTGGYFENTIGITDKKGDFETNYIAPKVSKTSIFNIIVNASKLGYNNSYIYDTITIKGD